MAAATRSSLSLRWAAIAIPLLASGIASADTDAKPRAVSGTPASNSNYWTETQGGLLGGLAGAPEQCTSKTCNLYYGDAPAEDATADTTVAPPAVAESVPVESDDAPRAARGRGDVVADGERSSCEPSPQDPWRCYRR